jgi:phosphosulfolactate synthase (CoM biosynthesis protein A)
MIALLLLAAANTEPEEILEDYLETVRLGELRAAASNRNNAEPEIEAICQANGTTTEGAFRAVVESLDLKNVLWDAGMSLRETEALMSWRGNL